MCTIILLITFIHIPIDVFIPEYTYNYMSMYTKVYVQLYVFKSYK